MDPREHWERVYQQKTAEEVSWYQHEPAMSLQLILETATALTSTIADVGGGASSLVDLLVSAGYRHLTVLDLSASALAASQHRLRDRAKNVRWVAGDILTTDLAEASLDLWHDRAVFHFLTLAADRERYLRQMRRILRPGGHAIVATFADDGPLRCSGLEVARYSVESLQATMGEGFDLVKSATETHLTPWKSQQAFIYCLFQWNPMIQPNSI
jgi:ubiquinone/menaquinone biosynthesis C-methylase UbiE